MPLHGTGRDQVPLEFLVQPGVFDRCRDLRREERQRMHILVREAGQFRALQVEHSDDLIPHD